MRTGLRPLTYAIVRALTTSPTFGLTGYGEAGISVQVSGASVTGSLLTATVNDSSGITSPTYEWRRNGVAIPGETASTYTTVYADTAGPVTCYCTWTDGNSNPQTATSNAIVVSADITMTLSGDASVNEGSEYSLTVAQSGADVGQITAYEVNWGDGTVESTAIGVDTHTYADGVNAYTITVTATHPNGTAVDTQAVSVVNVIPVATLTGAGTALVDVEYTATISSVTDPGADTVSNYRINWGDGSFDDYGTSGAKTHTYTAPATGLTVSLDLTDEDGTYPGVDSYSLDVSAEILPLFSRPYSETPSLEEDATFARASTALVTDHEEVLREIPDNGARFDGARAVRNLTEDSEDLSAERSAATSGATFSGNTITFTSGAGYFYRKSPAFLPAGDYVLSVTIASSDMPAVCLRLYNDGDSGNDTRAVIDTTVSGQTRFTASFTLNFSQSIVWGFDNRSIIGGDNTSTGDITLVSWMLEDATGRADPTIPSEYVSVGVLSDPWHGAGIDGLKYFATENGNTVADGTQGETDLFPSQPTASDWSPYGTNTVTDNPEGGVDITYNSHVLGAALNLAAFLTSPMVIGTDYKLTGEYKKQGTSTAADLRLLFGAGDNNFFAANAPNDNTWIRFEVVADATAGQQVIVGNGLTTGDVFSLRNLSLKEYTASNDTGIVTEATGALISPAPSLLMEPAATNQQTYSNDIGNLLAYKKLVCTTTASTTTSPDGSSVFTTIAEATGNSNRYVITDNNIVSVISGNDYTLSVFFKKGSGSEAGDWVQLTFRSAGFGVSQYANFNINTGVIGNSEGGIARIEEIGDNTGIFRCSFTVTATDTESVSAGGGIGLLNNADTASRLPSYGGNVNSDVLAWGFQLETGPVATSPIPTSGTAVTREANSLSYSGVPAGSNQETRALVNGGDNIDLENWDGAVDSPIATGPTLIESIETYADGGLEALPDTTDYDLVIRNNFTQTGTFQLAAYQGTTTDVVTTWASSIFYRKRGDASWTALEPDGTCIIDEVGEWEFGHDWNKSGNDCLTMSFKSITAIDACTYIYMDDATLGATVGNYFLFSAWLSCSSLTSLPINFNLPQGITSVGNNFLRSAWSGCTSLTSLPSNFNLPPGITTVNTGFMYAAWQSCTSLTSLPSGFNLPQSLTTVGNDFIRSAWRNCSSLTSLPSGFNLPQGLTTVGQRFLRGAWQECSGLTSLPSGFNLPQGLTTVSGDFLRDAWRDCTSLTSLPSGFNLPQSFTTVGNSFLEAAWFNCTSLTSLPSGFNLPPNMTTVGSRFLLSAWSTCTSLTSLPSGFNLPQGITTVGSDFLLSAWFSCSVLNNDGTTEDLDFPTSDYAATSVFAGSCPITPDSVSGPYPQAIAVNRS